VTNNVFFINVFTAGHLPSTYLNNASLTGVAGGASTNLGVQEATDEIPGAIGYLSTDFVQPYQTGSDPNGNPVPATINLQSYYTYSNHLTARYVAPTSTSTLAIVAKATPPTFSGSPEPASLAANWGVVVATPTSSGAYPAGGFAYFDVYSCYSSATDVDALFGQTAGSLGLLRWYFGSATENSSAPSNVLISRGFSPPPATWISAAKKLLFSNTATEPSTPGKKNTACATITKGA
jgi:ABC-type phosphate transport system substrate-binding protein